MPSVDSIQTTEHILLLLVCFCKSLQLNFSLETQFAHVPFLSLALPSFVYSSCRSTLWHYK